MIRNSLGLLLIILAVVVYVWFFLPKVRDVQEITVQKKAAEQLHKSREARLANLAQLEPIFGGQSDRLKRLTSALPQEPEVSELMISLEAMIRDSALTLQSIVPQVNRSDKEVTVTVVGQGPLDAVEALMDKVAENDRPMSVKGLTINSVQESDDLSFTLILGVPFVPSQAEVAGGGE